MKKIGIRLTAIMLMLILLVASVILVSAATTDAPATYSKKYNSGARNVVCTTLSGTSAASYYANHDYEDLSELSSSQIFSTLQTLMRTTHSYTSSYNDCHYKANQTDCTNGSGNVSLIYTSYSATMNQWNGWNREHVWPKSLGGNNTNGGGADLHHIRPSDAGVNSSRGNKKYGEAGANATQKFGTSPAVGVLGGTYNSTYFEPLDNVKGDVARICLYVYVRWNSSWGADSITDVFQSVDVLLEWCELDPVDSWEMGRNEVVGDIQGNRNVFIDYPEYAWLIFGREVPDDMTTPSGNAKQTTPPASTTPGATTPPSTLPPVTIPPVTTPSATLPPVTIPPVTTPPATLPPVTIPPVTTPSATLPPVTIPPVTTPPATIPPVTTPQVTTPQATPPTTPSPTPPVVTQGTTAPVVVPGTSAPAVVPGTSAPDLTPPTEGECTHAFGEWEDIGNGMKTRTCSLCGASEVSTKGDAAQTDTGCNSVIYGTSAVIAPVAILGFALVARKKKDSK